MAKAFLEKAGIAYTAVDADESPELVSEFGVRQAPTLVVTSGGKCESYANASEIKKFAEAGKCPILS